MPVCVYIQLKVLWYNLRQDVVFYYKKLMDCRTSGLVQVIMYMQVLVLSLFQYHISVELTIT